MSNENFIEQVQEFADYHCTNSMRDVEIEFIHSDVDPQAILTCEDIRGYEWVLTILPDHDNDLVIDDKEFYKADTAGLYEYLWIKTMDKMQNEE